MIYFRIIFFLCSLVIFSLGISITINVQHLGLHPWDVLNVGMYHKVGLSIGSWNIIIGFLLITISFLLDRSYVKLGTFLNAIVVGSFVDFFLWLDFLPEATHSWTDSLIMMTGIVVMGVGGGMYNAAGVGSGPRDGFMLSLADKTGMSIGKVRIMTETSILVVGFLIGGPVFIFSILFTFIQSPIFQFIYLKFVDYLNRLENRWERKRSKAV